MIRENRVEKAFDLDSINMEIVGQIISDNIRGYFEVLYKKWDI